MALYFDLLKLESLTNGDPEYMITALEHWYNKRYIPKNKYEKYKPLKEPLNGKSFLINPRDFFDDKTTDVLFRAQYLQLAGRRDYLLYKQYGVTYLDLSHFPDINKKIYTNPLINLKENKLHFKYEEK